MIQKPEEVLKDLSVKKYAPIYFLQGNESYYIDKISNFIEKQVLSIPERSFNQSIFYGKDVSIRQILNQAKRFPVMADRQVVIIKEAQEITDLRTETAKALLIAYCENPAQTTILVFCHKHKRLDSRTQLFKKLQQSAIVVEAKKLYDHQIPAKIIEIVKDQGYRISPKATSIFAEHIGNDLTRIANELHKLLLNLEKDTEITERHITDYVGVSREFNTFELQSAIGAKNILKATQIVRFFANNPKEHPVIPTIALLFGYFSKLLLLHHSKDKSKSVLAKKLSVNPYFISDYEEASRNYPISKVIHVFSLLRRADLQSKGVNSNTKDHEILKELVFKILYL